MKIKKFCLIVIFFGLYQIYGQSLTDTMSQNSKNSMHSGLVLQIIGTWNIYSDFYESIISDSLTVTEMTICNDCPSIVFNENFTATLINFSDHHNEIYKWSIKADSLYMEYQGDPAVNHYFGKQKYKMVFLNFDTHLKLSLYISETYGYIISKN